MMNTTIYVTTACIPQDIMFMVDTSSGVGANNFREELEFVKSTIRNYHVSAQCIRVGIMTFSGQVYNNIKFGQYSTTSELMSAIDQIQYQPGRRYTTEALKYLNSNVFGQFGNARAGAQHIGVLVSNGQASNALAFAQEAKRVRDSGTKLYTVGIGTGFHLQDLKNAASNPHSRYAMNAQNFDSLGDLAYPLSTRTNSGKLDTEFVLGVHVKDTIYYNINSLPHLIIVVIQHALYS